jgi:hypothetical protein
VPSVPITSDHVTLFLIGPLLVIPALMKVLVQYDSEPLLIRSFFQFMEAKNLATTFIGPKPVAQFGSGVELGYRVGTRGNGIDQSISPKDLTAEIIIGSH